MSEMNAMVEHQPGALGAGVGAVADTQATRDLVTSATLAFEDKDLDAQAKVKRTWKDVARNYWAKSAVRDQKEKIQTPKFHRVKVRISDSKNGICDQWDDFCFGVDE